MARRVFHALLLGALMPVLVSAGRSAGADAMGRLEARVRALEARHSLEAASPGHLLVRIERLERLLASEAEATARSTPRGSPVAGGVVTSGASRARLHPILGRSLPHTGVDIGAPPGSPIRATADGVVASRFSSPTYGLGVDLDHGRGSFTRYAHMQRVGVRAGQRVRRGDVIGYVGMTGRATGPHVHYEVFVRWHRVDPAPYLPDSMAVAAGPGGPTDF